MVIVEEFIKFDSEITLLTIKQRPNVASRARSTIFVPHRAPTGAGRLSGVMDPTSHESIRPPTSSKAWQRR